MPTALVNPPVHIQAGSFLSKEMYETVAEICIDTRGVEASESGHTNEGS
jgi:hypothetical protein